MLVFRAETPDALDEHLQPTPIDTRISQDAAARSSASTAHLPCPRYTWLRLAQQGRALVVLKARYCVSGSGCPWTSMLPHSFIISTLQIVSVCWHGCVQHPTVIYVVSGSCMHRALSFQCILMCIPSLRARPRYAALLCFERSGVHVTQHSGATGVHE